MGILQRLDRRIQKENSQLPAVQRRSTPRKKHQLHAPLTPDKNGGIKLFSSPRSKPLSSSSLSSSRKQMIEIPMKIPNNGDDDKPVQINRSTELMIQREVENLLDPNNPKCTLLHITFAIKDNHDIIDSYAKGTETSPIKRFFALFPGQLLNQNGFPKEIKDANMNRGRPFSNSWNFNKYKEETARRYKLMGVLDRLEKDPSSQGRFVSSWEEAKECLKDVINFPSSVEDTQNIDPETTDTSFPSIAEKYEKKLNLEMEKIKLGVDALSFEGLKKWERISEYPLPPPAGKTGAEAGENEIEYLKTKLEYEKSDLLFNARLKTQEELDEALRSTEAKKALEDRMKRKEAEKRASSLMRPLNEEEQAIVEEAMYGDGPDYEVIARCGPDTVQRKSIRTLQPGQWLNDEVIHYFLLMLAKRDEEMCKNDPSRKISHFFKSFFITKLLNEGNPSCDGVYEYKNVKRWSKRIPGKDIFNLDKIIFPINVAGQHWICAVIFVQEKRIQIYDSFGSEGRRYLDALFQYLQDEHQDKKKKPLPNIDEWKLVGTVRETPRQKNGMYCDSSAFVFQFMLLLKMTI
jgi:sentrin-specific protease 1